MDIAMDIKTGIVVLSAYNMQAIEQPPSNVLCSSLNSHRQYQLSAWEEALRLRADMLPREVGKCV